MSNNYSLHIGPSYALCSLDNKNSFLLCDKTSLTKEFIKGCDAYIEINLIPASIISGTMGLISTKMKEIKALNHSAFSIPTHKNIIQNDKNPHIYKDDANELTSFKDFIMIEISNSLNSHDNVIPSLIFKVLSDELDNRVLDVLVKEMRKTNRKDIAASEFVKQLTSKFESSYENMMNNIYFRQAFHFLPFNSKKSVLFKVITVLIYNRVLNGTIRLDSDKSISFLHSYLGKAVSNK